MVGRLLKETWEKNYLANKDTILKTKPFLPLMAGKQDFRPCVVVGAGPSLDKNVNLLEPKLYDIVACDKTVPKLTDLGITPTYVVAINAAPTDTNEWTESAKDKTNLVMPCGVFPGTYKGWDAGHLVFINNCVITCLHERIEAELHLTPVVIGSNAGTMAYMVAAMTMHNPIAYIGMDFSFTGKASILASQDPRHYNLLEMTDVNGEVRYLNLGWFDMAEAFQENVKYFREWYGIPTYNCTEGGINYSEYVGQMPLCEFNLSLKKGGERVDDGRWGF